MYELLKHEADVKFYPYNNITLYTDNDEFEDLKEAIYIVADENKYELEVIYDEDIDVDDIIDAINQNELCNIVILLTQNRETKDKFTQNITEKKLFINENPYKKEYGVIYAYLN